LGNQSKGHDLKKLVDASIWIFVEAMDPYRGLILLYHKGKGPLGRGTLAILWEVTRETHVFLAGKPRTTNQKIVGFLRGGVFKGKG